MIQVKSKSFFQTTKMTRVESSKNATLVEKDSGQVTDSNLSITGGKSNQRPKNECGNGN